MIARAYEEIRLLIEAGEIAPDQVTNGWLAQWAALLVDDNAANDDTPDSWPVAWRPLRQTRAASRRALAWQEGRGSSGK